MGAKEGCGFVCVFGVAHYFQQLAYSVVQMFTFFVIVILYRKASSIVFRRSDSFYLLY